MAVAMGAGGCDSRSASSDPPTSKASPSASSSSSPAATDVATQCKKFRRATGPVAAEFGAAKVAAAECEMAVFTLEGSFLPKLMQATSFAKADFAPFRAYMTPVARRAWDADVAKVSRSGIRRRSALNAVASITYVDITGHTYTLGNSRTSQPVSNRRLTSGRVRLVSVHGKRRLRLSLTMAFRLNLTERKSGRPVTVDGQKSVAYTLVPNPGGKDKPFLIDGWRGRSRFGSVKAAAAP